MNWRRASIILNTSYKIEFNPMSQSSLMRPYGSWKSPITTDKLVEKAVKLGQICVDTSPDNNLSIYWNESRPTENGRNVVLRCDLDGQMREYTPSGYNARTRVHEYGGGAFVGVGGKVYFTNYADQKLYCADGAGNVQAITSAEQVRFADARVDVKRNRLVCVREDHRAGGEAVNTIASVKLAGDEAGSVLVSGNDFYSNPRLSPDGTAMAWLTWNHPNMPWDGCELWVAEVLADGQLAKATLVAGGKTESIFQPEWSPNGVLYFVSDRSGWWNVYRWQYGQIEAVCPMSAEFGAPAWVFGESQYGFENEHSIICAYGLQGVWQMGRLDLSTHTLTNISTPYTSISDVFVCNGYAVFCGGSPTASNCVVRLNLQTHACEEIRQSYVVDIEPGYFSVPETVEFPTENGKTAFAFYYPPHNKDYNAPSDEKPPLLVKSHGGPTSATSSAFDYRIQYWTSRGIAVLDVNYGGSTGYGRDYRERLNGNWGIVDVDDCVNGARYLAENGLVDGNRLAIDGGSAGGYTTLAALTFRNIFKAGASYFGVSDLAALAQDTHKFESRYLDGLVGRYPQEAHIYHARSPIHHTDKINCPIILFQGLEDLVVPPNQAVMMFEAVRAKEIPVAYVPFEGEQHGFRRAENIKRCAEAELYFYSKVFKFETADAIAPVQIENLDE
jgi:dipeptidyl aminopeptidase/acylaminoacyl peptidase